MIKSNAERQAKHRAKMKAEGYTLYREWVPKAYLETIKKVVAAEVKRLGG